MTSRYQMLDEGRAVGSHRTHFQAWLRSSAFSEARPHPLSANAAALNLRREDGRIRPSPTAKKRPAMRCLTAEKAPVGLSIRRVSFRQQWRGSNSQFVLTRSR